MTEHLCPQCHISHSTPTGSTIVPLDLLADFTQVCYWLSSFSQSLTRGESIDVDLLRLAAEQAELVRTWAIEFTPVESHKTGGDADG